LKKLKIKNVKIEKTSKIINMTPLPDYRPKQLSVGPLEAEILSIVWELGSATVKDVHDRILADPDRELAYTSVTTVLRRLTEKGWLACNKEGKAFYWRPLLTKQQAEVIKAQSDRKTHSSRTGSQRRKINMHLFMIITAVAVAYWLRSSGNIPQGNWHLRWQKTLFLFLFPPLLIFMTVTAVVCMGTQGKMGGMYTNPFSYILALISLGFFNILGLKLVLGGWKAIKSARECPQVNLNGKPVRILQTGALFAGQIGFWQPELVVSEGLLETLSPIHLESVLAHEQGHYQYRDTFWFFWLGWMRSCTAWLPNTEPLWQELLVLRELRADSYAASQVDPLVLTI